MRFYCYLIQFKILIFKCYSYIDKGLIIVSLQLYYVILTIAISTQLDCSTTFKVNKSYHSEPQFKHQNRVEAEMI